MSFKKSKDFILTYLDLAYQEFLSKKFPVYFRKVQQKKLRKHLKEITTHSTYYKSLVKNPKKVTLEDFPIMNKAVMMREFDQLNTRGIKLQQAKTVALKSEESRDFSPKIDDISVGLSSGTTGNQGVFLVSEQETTQWAAAMMKKAIDREKFGKNPIIIAFFMRANNNLYTSINQKKITLHFFDLLASMDENLTKLDQIQPNVIVAQPSMLREIANYYQYKEKNYEIKELFSIAEVLEATDRSYIEGRLGVPIREIYQATEGFLGISCKYGTIHLNEDIVYIEKEYIDEHSRRFVPIITDLYRSTQPLIRYRHTDILVEKAEPCPCGSSFMAIEKIEGREDDCFKAKLGSTWIRIFPDFIRYAITRAHDSIVQFQAVQQGEYKIEVFLESFNRTDQEEMQTKVRNNLVKLFPTEYQQKLDITVSFMEFTYKKDQKLRRVISNLKEGECT